MYSIFAGICSSRVEYIPHWQDDNLIFPGEFNANEFILERGIELINLSFSILVILGSGMK